MYFQQLLTIVGDEPFFETGLLLAGDVDPRDVRRQLSRWVRAGKVFQLRRGLYMLAPTYRKVVPHPFLTANHLRRPSYVSLHSALAHYGMIPEYAPAVVSVTTARPGALATPIGSFRYRHVRGGIFQGYEEIEVAPGQTAFVATPEKALIDTMYLTPGGGSREFLEGLRLQRLEKIKLENLEREAAVAGGDKLKRAVAVVVALAAQEDREYESL